MDIERKLKENDIVIGEYSSTTLDTLLLFTDKGNYVYLPVSKIPDTRHKDLGYNVSTLANITADEKIIFSVPISDFEEDKYLLFTTKKGFIKRVHIKDFKATRYSNALQATKINEDDELVSVDITAGNQTEVVVITKEGFINHFNSSEVSIYLPVSVGRRALEMSRRQNDEVIAELDFSEATLK